MVPYLRMLQGFFLYGMNFNEINRELKKMSLPTINKDEFKIVLEKTPPNEWVYRLLKWLRNEAIDPDFDILFYRFLVNKDLRTVLIGSMELDGTEDYDKISTRISQAGYGFYPAPAIEAFHKVFWDTTGVDMDKILDIINHMGAQYAEKLNLVYTGRRMDAELSLGLIPDVAPKDFMKLLIASGMKAIQDQLKANMSDPRNASLALKAIELLYRYDKESEQSPIEFLELQLEQVEDSQIATFDEVVGGTQETYSSGKEYKGEDRDITIGQHAPIVENEEPIYDEYNDYDNSYQEYEDYDY